MKILLFLLFAAQLSAQNITVFCGTQNQSVTPEVAKSLNLKPSEILSPERFQQAKEASQIKVEPLIVTGDGSPENPYKYQTAEEKIRALAEEIAPTDPETAAMLIQVANIQRKKRKQ